MCLVVELIADGLDLQLVRLNLSVMYNIILSQQISDGAFSRRWE
jgi:hypothetical protein